MKKNSTLLIVLFFFFSINYIKAQFAENNSMYATTEFDFLVRYIEVEFELEPDIMVHKNKYSLKIGYSRHKYSNIAESTP